MAKITVYKFKYENPDNLAICEGKGMRTREDIERMRETEPEKKHEVCEDSGITIDETDLSETGAYYPEVEVTDPAPDSDTDIMEFSYKHSCDTNAVMSCSRDPATDEVTLTCPVCGFRFSFPQKGGDAELIAKVAIDGVARDMTSKPVRIVPGNPVNDATN